MIFRFIFSLIVFATFQVQAAELAGVRLADEIEIEGKKLRLNGLGLSEETIFNIDFYVVGLYLENRSLNPRSILDSGELKKIELKFFRDVDKEELQDTWQTTFNENCGNRCGGHMRRSLIEFNSYMRDIKDGDTMSLTFLPNRVEIHHQRQKIADITGQQFARLLLSTWLGPNTPSPTLRNGILGRASQ